MFTKRIVILALICSIAGILAAPIQSQTQASASIPAKFQKLFEGKIADKYAIHLDLSRADQNLFGSYYYDSVGTSIDVSGTVDARGKFKMTETDSTGTETAAFNGTISLSGSGDLQVMKLSGTWQKTGGVSPLSFNVIELKFDLGMGAKVGSKKINRAVKKQYAIEMEYPQVTGLVDPGQDAFNKYVEAIVTKEVMDFKGSASDQSGLPPDTQPSSLDMGYEVEYASTKIICATLWTSEYDAGAAHPNSFSTTINYDTTARKDLKLSDLFKPNTRYLTAISQYCVAQLLKKLGKDDADTINEGASPKADNFKNWTITDSGLLILFNPYAVASYAEGPQQVLIPYSKLATLLDPLGPAGGFLK